MSSVFDVAGAMTGVELGDEIRKLHVMRGGVAGLEEVDEVLEQLDLAGDPQCPVVGVAELLLRQPEQVLEQRVVQVVGFHLELARHVLAHVDGDVAFRGDRRLGIDRSKALGSAAPHFLDEVAHDPLD